ncbi:hypothetical protein [Yinghuangia seranimata]|uniref:hypothetical protein n=1 Tax=Yinghuangia seranimata TaxID=408067 RepID=UPI00248CC0A6|nr:hypothetical protein [Yinghuangia seranimata]MDI2127879.1 hypothetical protein [Yinghuangia seranimata]
MSPRSRVAAYTAFLVWAFVTAFVFGRLVGDGRPGSTGPAAPGTKVGHSHGLGPFAPQPKPATSQI